MIKLIRPPAKILDQGTFPLPGMPGTRFTIGRDVVADAVADVLREAKGHVAVDTEGAGAKGRKRFDLKAVIIGHATHSVILDPRDPFQFNIIRGALNGEDVMMTFHNSPHDVPIMYLTGMLDLESVWRTEDTLLWARLAEPAEKSRRDLRNAANRHLGENYADPLTGILKTLRWTKDRWYQEADLEIPAYRFMAASDAITTARLRPAVRAAALERITTGHPFSVYGVKGDEAEYLVDREQITNRIHLERSCIGYLVDPEYLDWYRANAAKDLHRWAAELEAEGITPDKNASLMAWLEERKLIPANYPVTPKTKEPSGAKDNVKKLNHPVAKKFIAHKELLHLDRDYLSKAMENADDNGRIHPVYNILGAGTGRESISGDAPLHQFSGLARGIILADNWEEAKKYRLHDVVDANGDACSCTCVTPKGLVSIDWSQIEPVIAANIAGDTQAIEYYESGHKFYNAITAATGVSYKAAKVTLLAQLYGEGLFKLSQDLGVSMQEAAQIRDLVWKALPKTQELAGRGGKLQTIANQYEQIFTLSGRIVPVPAGWWPCWECDGAGFLPADNEPDDPDNVTCWRCDGKKTEYKVAVHKGVNYFVQGGAYDVLAETQVQLWKSGLHKALYLTMHDECVVDAEAAHDIRRIMETPPDRLVMMAKRTPKLRTDMAHMGERWVSV